MKSGQDSKLVGNQKKSNEEKLSSQVKSSSESGILSNFVNEPMSSHKIVLDYLYKVLVKDQGRSKLITLGDYDYIVVLDKGYLDMLIANFGVGEVSQHNGEFYGIMCLQFSAGVTYSFHFIVPNNEKDLTKGKTMSEQFEELNDYLGNKIGKIVTENDIKLIIEEANKKTN